MNGPVAHLSALGPRDLASVHVFRKANLGEMRFPRATDPTPAAGDRSEADLVQRCLEGDAAAWDTLVRVYWKRVFNMAYKFVAQFDEAEDLTQEIFVKLFRALPTFDRRASFETWLTRVSRNLCIDRYRRRRREEGRFTGEIDPDTIQLDELVSRPDTSLEQRDRVATVRRALAILPPTYRQAVALRDVHDLSYEEIAQRLQLPEGTVKSRINRGRKELARHLRILQEHAPPSATERKRSRDRQEASYAKD
jgi:RNA polymerase sigma-70 factor, ECF subfamily